MKSKIRPSEALEQHRDTIREILLRHNASNPRVFGSTIRGEDTIESDLDLLVDVSNVSSLLDLGMIAYELETLLGVKVDLITSSSIRKGLKEVILNEAQEL